MSIETAIREMMNILNRHDREIRAMTAKAVHGAMHTGLGINSQISSGAVTVYGGGWYILEPEAGIADDLDTIDGGRAGKIVAFQVNDSANAITLKDGTGNLSLDCGDIILDDVSQTATLIYDENNLVWIVFAVSCSAISATLLDLDELNDVIISAPDDNEILAYDIGSGTWINQTAAEAGIIGYSTISLGSEEVKVLSGDAFSLTAGKGFYSVESESGFADDLTTINGGTDGDLIVIKAASSHTITAKDGTGNLYLDGDKTLDSNQDKLMLIYDNGVSGWCQTSWSGN